MLRVAFPVEDTISPSNRAPSNGCAPIWDHVLAHTDRHEISRVGLVDLVAALVDALALPGAALRSRAPKAGVIGLVMHAASQSDYQASVREISVRLNISRRSIEYAFREYLGVSPQSYFTLRRLNRCRSLLTEADPENSTVTDIATRCGFHELGRFAATYHHQFGERPSESLRQARMHVPTEVCPIG